MVSNGEIALLALIPLVVLALFLDRYMNRTWSEYPRLGPIAPEQYPVHPTKTGIGRHRVYLVAGGSGFTGSWIVRYLLMRGEKSVHILDRRRPPGDVLRHGAQFSEVNLGASRDLEAVMTRINTRIHSNTQVIVYNCSVVKRYYAPTFEDLGLQAAESLEVNLRVFTQQGRHVTVIHIGDTLCHREPAGWWNPRGLYVRKSRYDLDKVLPFALRDQNRAFTSYSWYQGAVEMLTRAIGSPPLLATGCVRVDGYASGHVNDSFLTPALRYGGGLLHNWGIPMTLVHVEDVARTALALEYRLLDPETRSVFSGGVFTISGTRITTLEKIYDYIRLRKPDFRIIRIQPIVVWLVSLVVSLLSIIFRLKPKPGTQPQPLLCGSLSTLTLARFATLQVGQVPDQRNAYRLKTLLGIEPNFSLSQIIDGVIDEIEVLDKARKTR